MVVCTALLERQGNELRLRYKSGHVRQCQCRKLQPPLCGVARAEGRGSDGLTACLRSKELGRGGLLPEQPCRIACAGWSSPCKRQSGGPDVKGRGARNHCTVASADGSKCWW